MPAQSTARRPASSLSSCLSSPYRLLPIAASEPSVGALIKRAHTNREALDRLFARYRPFLMVMARQQIGLRLAVRSDASDIVQQTLLDAYQAFSQFRGVSEPEFSRWIQEIYGHNLADAVQKHLFAAKRSRDCE